MVFFSKKAKQLNQKINAMHQSIRDSFSKVRGDMDATHAWLNHYHQQGQYLESQIQALHQHHTSQSQTSEYSTQSMQHTLAEHTRMIKELTGVSTKLAQDLVNLHTSHNFSSRDEVNFHIEKISIEVQRIDQKIQELSHMKASIEAVKNQLNVHITSTPDYSSVENRINQIQEKLNQLVLKKSPKQKLIQKVVKKNHEYVRIMVLNYIRKYEKISAYQLREIVVEEQNLTSKSTFYRILEEIEQSGEVTTVKQGKEKHYLANIKRTA